MNPNPKDAELGPLLRGNFQVSLEKNPTFRTEVWARIEANRKISTSWAAWLSANARRCALLAVATMAIASVGGGWIAKAQTKHDREELVQRYLASIDPHQRN